MGRTVPQKKVHHEYRPGMTDCGYRLNVELSPSWERVTCGTCLRLRTNERDFEPLAEPTAEPSAGNT